MGPYCQPAPRPGVVQRLGTESFSFSPVGPEHPNLFSSHSIMRSFLLLVYAALVVAQQDPIQDFCRRHQHQTCVIDDKLYIDGGQVYYGVSVENGSSPQQSKSSRLSKSMLLMNRHTSVMGEYPRHGQRD